MMNKSDRLLLAVDFAGTFVFAVEGAAAAIEGKLDFFGVMVLSFAAVLAVRDVLLARFPSVLCVDIYEVALWRDRPS